jgi:hypothetical protein
MCLVNGPVGVVVNAPVDQWMNINGTGNGKHVVKNFFEENNPSNCSFAFILRVLCEPGNFQVGGSWSGQVLCVQR